MALASRAKPLYSDDYLVAVLESGGVVLLTRTRAPFAGSLDVRASFLRLERAIRDLDRGKHALLIDARTAPFRMPPEASAAFQRERIAITRGFAAVAVLVKTAIGKMVVRTLNVGAAVPHVAFSEPVQARVYLTDQLKAKARR